MQTVVEAEGPIAGYHSYITPVPIDDERALVVGADGFRIVDLETGQDLVHDDTLDGGHVAFDASTGRAWIAPNASPGIVQVDVSDPLNPVIIGAWTDFADANQKLSADGGRVLVGTEGPALLYDLEGNQRAIFPVQTSYGVALRGDRALVADQAELLLFDVSDPDAPVELDRIALPGSGFDVEFDGEQVAVALGAAGIEVLRVEGDALVSVDHVELPSSSYDVALDGAYLWAAAWSVIALVHLDEQSATVLGHHPTAQFAIGIGARHGRAVAGELDHLHVIDRVEGLAGPELHLPDDVWITPGSAEPVPVTITNHGALPLALTFHPNDDFVVSTDALALEPAESVTVDLTPVDGATSAMLSWTSNDPDEPSGAVHVDATSDVVGQPHPPFTAPSFTWPDETVMPLTNDELLGKVVLLVYFRVDCLVCGLEVPDLAAMLDTVFGDDPDFELVLVNVDEDGFDSAWTFVDSLELAHPCLLDAGLDLYYSYGTAPDDSSALSVPLHAVIDRDGVITYFQQEADVEGITAAVEAALASPSVAK